MKTKRQVTYMLMALAMALMLVLSGCGSLGSSQDFGHMGIYRDSDNEGC